MKLAISSEGSSHESPVDPRFGRAKWFMIFDTDSRAFEAVDNESAAGAMQGAGIKAAESLADHGIGTVITGHCGPKAFQALRQAGIEVVVNAEGSVAEAVNRYLAGELKPTDGPDVDGHWR
jgi:predicted Fe-Mo cluster-binding NifX family protein